MNGQPHAPVAGQRCTWEGCSQPSTHAAYQSFRPNARRYVCLSHAKELMQVAARLGYRGMIYDRHQ